MASSSLILRLMLQTHRSVIAKPIKLSRTTYRFLSESNRASIIETSPRPPDPTPCVDRHSLDPFSKINNDYQKTYLDELRPPLKRSFNLAAYVNTSETLQKLVKLGVSLFDIENLNIVAAKNLVLLDFERDCVPYLKFLVDSGLREENLGRFISECPQLFRIPLQDLHIRLKYLKSKKFTKSQIAHGLNISSHMISNNINFMDYKLGQLQVEFSMSGENVRKVVSQHPQIISLPEEQYKLIQFCLNEEFGFLPQEINLLLLGQSNIIDIPRPELISRLDLIHNIMGLSHQIIVRYPKLVTSPESLIRHRFLYLQKLRRNQFDHTQPLYVPPSALYRDRDEIFCLRYAKTKIQDYELFLKSI